MKIPLNISFCKYNTLAGGMQKQNIKKLIFTV